MRVASFGEGGTFSVAVDGKTLLAPIAVPDTGGWQNWQTVTINGLPLTAGTHVLRINMLLIGRSGITGNFNWLQIRPTTGLPGLTATYYDTDAFSGVSFQGTVPNIDFNWDVGSPLAGIAPDTFSAASKASSRPPPPAITPSTPAPTTVSGSGSITRSSSTTGRGTPPPTAPPPSTSKPDASMPSS